MWQERTELLIGKKNIEKLQRAHVLVAGLGGVGAYAAEMLCRTGIGTLTIIDADIVTESNINRQLIALNTTVGKSKTDLVAERLTQINKNVKLNVHNVFMEGDIAAKIISAAKYNYAIDAIDTLSPKVELIKLCIDNNLPLVSAMGAGAKLDPEKIRIADISKTHECPLAHMLRKRLHAIGIYKGFKAVFSTEKIIESALVECDGERNKKTTVGTISYLPAVFGCYCASVAIRDIINEE